VEFKHTSVLLEEVLEGLNIRPDGIYVDGTLGGGGHSFHIAERLTEGGCLISIDQDEDALRAAGERLAPFADRVSFVHDNYENMENAVRGWLTDHPDKARAGADGTSGSVDGILLDLGVSS
jgi:16S rRNA (cytosine1402-N4)-methyltransferase